jgi:L-alanine-DL-glutamate epimerase-like enolase superfamily enzyme
MPRITDIRVSVYKVPTDFPESDGTFEWDNTTIVIVHLYAGEHVGLGYTYADPATASVIAHELTDAITGLGALDIPAAATTMNQHLRNVGTQAISSMAISAVDVALWDWKAKHLGLPLADLLGRARHSVPIYGSGGFTSYPVQKLQEQLSGWVASGMGSVKMKIGRDPKADIERVRKAREAIGPAVGLMLDANGAYTAKQALRQAEAFQQQDVCWFEEPVPSSNPEGLRFIREHTTIDIAAGEYGYVLSDFQALLQCVDVLQADATRCQGISGFLKASTLAESANLAISSHCGPTIHMHLGASVPNFKHLEYFHDHARIEQLLFDGVVAPKNGNLTPDPARPGLGIELKEKDAECYKVSGAT